MSRSTLATILLVVALVSLAAVGAWWKHRPVPQTGNVYRPEPSPASADPDTTPYDLTYVPAGVVGDGPTVFETVLAGIVIDRKAHRLYAAGDRAVKVFDHCSALQRKIALDAEPLSIGLDGQGNVLVGFAGKVVRLSPDGETLGTLAPAGLGRVTAVAGRDGRVFAADADARIIRRLDAAGRQVARIPAAAAEPNRIDTFLLPNKTLDFFVSDAGEVVAVNPGRHAVQFYAPDGTLLREWGEFGERDPAKFTGCCNPMNVAALAAPSGPAIVTAEKAASRVKVYGQGGELLGVIAAGNFNASNRRMPLATDAGGMIYVADTEARVIRRFKRE